jgi:DeoR/GlpR family transcriptional regulator of sugar metabolism
MVEAVISAEAPARPRLRKDERRAQIVLELRLRPHVRIGELAERFGVSAETIRRDVEALAGDGLVSRSHGGATARAHGRHPGLDERSAARVAERERIGRRAAALVRAGETVMVDSGSTTLQFARFLAYLGTPCTVITNSLPVAMTLGHAGTDVILCPGDYLPEEAATIGTDAVDFLARHHADRCMIGASGLTADGPGEAVRGFAAIKRAMIGRSGAAHLLIDSEKFGRPGLATVAPLGDLASVVIDAAPRGQLMRALGDAAVEVLLAD